MWLQAHALHHPGIRPSCLFTLLCRPLRVTLPLLAHPLPAAAQVWIFVGLNKADPAAAVTLKQMDRH